MAKEVNKKAVKIFEIIWYTLCSLVIVWGLTYIVLGLIAQYANVPDNKNYLLQASNDLAKTFGGLGFFQWGLIIFSSGVVAAVLVLLIVSGTVDKTSEKAARRAARLAKIEADMAAQAEAEAK